MYAVILSLAAIPVAVSTGPEAAPSLALLDGNPDWALCAVVGSKLAASAQSSKRLSRVVSGQDLRDLLNVSQTRCLLDTDNADCLVDLTNTLKVRYVLVTNLRQLKDRIILSLRVLDTSDGTARLRINREYLSEAVLLDDVPALAGAVVGSLFGETTVLKDTLAIELRRRRIRRISLGSGTILTVGGLGLMVASAAAQSTAQQTFDQNPNKDSDSLQALFDAESTNQSAYLLGVTSGVIGLSVAVGGWWLWR
jgi:hypothetical protein